MKKRKDSSAGVAEHIAFDARCKDRAENLQNAFDARCKEGLGPEEVMASTEEISWRIEQASGKRRPVLVVATNGAHMPTRPADPVGIQNEALVNTKKPRAFASI